MTIQEIYKSPLDWEKKSHICVEKEKKKVLGYRILNALTALYISDTAPHKLHYTDYTDITIANQISLDLERSPLSTIKELYSKKIHLLSESGFVTQESAKKISDLCKEQEKLLKIIDSFKENAGRAIEQRDQDSKNPHLEFLGSYDQAQAKLTALEDEWNTFKSKNIIPYLPHPKA